MSKIKESLKKTINTLQEEKVILSKKKTTYKFAETKEEAKELMTEIITTLDTSIKKFEWLPEYDNVVEWMLGSDKGLLIAGDPGLGKSNIIKLLIPTLFHMKYDMIIRPVEANQLKERWDTVSNAPVVIVDEVGDERMDVEKYNIKYWAFEDVVRMCEAESKTLFVTTNLNKNQLTTRYNARITDRLDYLVTAFRIKGSSLR